MDCGKGEEVQGWDSLKMGRYTGSVEKERWLIKLPGRAENHGGKNSPAAKVIWFGEAASADKVHCRKRRTPSCKGTATKRILGRKKTMQGEKMMKPAHISVYGSSRRRRKMHQWREKKKGLSAGKKIRRDESTEYGASRGGDNQGRAPIEQEKTGRTAGNCVPEEAN